MNRIIVFGSGTAHGLWDVQGGWAQRLRTQLEQKTLETRGNQYYEVYNLGIRGEDTGTVLDRFDNEMKARYDDDHEETEHTVIFQVGANDTVFVYEEDDLLNDEEDFRENVRELIQKAKKYTDQVMFLGMIPVDDEDIEPIPAIEGRSYTTARMDGYNDAIREVCEEEGAVFVNIYKQFGKDADNLLEDGLHPNGEGHNLIHQKVKQKLTENDWI
jgi:lysophospholipase L1-like esterase